MITCRLAQQQLCNYSILLNLDTIHAVPALLDLDHKLVTMVPAILDHKLVAIHSTPATLDLDRTSDTHTDPAKPDDSCDRP